MAKSRLKRPPKRGGGEGQPSISKSDIEHLISKGGSSPRKEAKGISEGVSHERFLVRVKTSTIERIAESIALRPYEISRNRWIQEAIHEKLENEE